MRTVHLVSVKDSGKQFFVEDYEVKDGKVKQKYWEEDGYGESYSVTFYVDVEIDNTYFVIINADFLLREKDDAYIISNGMGFGNVASLAYTYSVIIVEKPGNSGSIYTQYCIHSEAGMRKTNFDMYSYHLNEPEFHYTPDRLEYEVWESLNLKKIILKED